MRLFLTLLLALVCCTGRAAIFQNSFTTNALGTNLVWDPTQRSLTINGDLNLPGYFQITSNGITYVNLDMLPGASVLPTLDLITYLRLSNGTNRLTDDGTNLLRNGIQIATAGNTTNTFNYVTITNLNVLNNVTISNLSVTNITVQTINITTNLYNVAKGGHLTITNDFTPQQVGASKLVATATDGSLTNANGVFTTRGAVLYKGANGWTNLNPNTAGYVLTDGGVGADPAWAAAAGGGGSVTVNATNVSTPNLKDTADITWAIATATNAQPSFAALTWNALTYSASNVVMDCSLGNSQVAHYKLVLTNSTTQFGIPTSIPTTPKTYWIWFQQDATGVRTVQWTNTTFKFPGATQPVIDTNANAVSLVMFATGPFTNSLLNYVGTQPRIQ